MREKHAQSQAVLKKNELDTFFFKILKIHIFLEMLI